MESAVLQLKLDDVQHAPSEKIVRQHSRMEADMRAPLSLGRNTHAEPQVATLVRTIFAEIDAQWAVDDRLLQSLVVALPTNVLAVVVDTVVMELARAATAAATCGRA